MKPEAVVGMTALVVGVGLVALIPWFSARSRKHRNATPILVLCLFCFVVGLMTLFHDWPVVVRVAVFFVWVVALALSFVADQEAKNDRPDPRRPYQPDPRGRPQAAPVATAATQVFTCPHCASDIEVPPSLVGSRVVCPWCRGVFRPAVA